MQNAKSTRERLIEIAGELFARVGYEAVSTRLIADKTGVKLSAIHYHFGSKENLYAEALRFAIENNGCANFASISNAHPEFFETKKGLARLIYLAISASFEDHFIGDSPWWMSQLILREVMEPSKTFSFFIEKKIEPDIAVAKKIFEKVRHNVKESEIYGWLDLFHSQLFFYMMTKDTMTLIRGTDALNAEFIRSTGRVVARAMINELQLELPDELQSHCYQTPTNEK